MKKSETPDAVIRYCTARIASDAEISKPIGSGVLIRQKGLDEKIYLLTAAHCLKDETKAQLSSIRVEVYNPKARVYEQIRVGDLPNQSVVANEEQKDVAVVILSAKDVLAISPDLPMVKIVAERANCARFICAGFPIANKNEYDQTNAGWIHADVATNQFYLHMENDYIADYAMGFSGGGIFCETNNELLLYGIMKEYRKEERGKVLYGEDLSYVNELLYALHQPKMYISYIAVDGLTEKAVYDHLDDTYDALGDRFIRNFNEPAPIENIIEATCRTPQYFDKIESTIDRWLENQHLYLVKTDAIMREFSRLRSDLFRYAMGVRQHPTEDIDFSAFIDQASNIIRRIDATCDSITDNDTKSKLSLIRDYCYQLLENVESFNVSATNNRFVIVEGEAGCGKSHLFGHVSREIRKQGCPVLLYLGEQISTQSSIADNILLLSSLTCSIDDMLAGLNSVGKRMGRRVPILIDALNETEDMTYWRNRLPGFVKSFKKYPYIALIVSIRDTYLKRVVTSTYLEQWENNIFLHEGLRGVGYKALKDFCTYYTLKPMSIPNLHPELTNPLYLHMACQIAKESGQNELPIGSDMHTLFDKYVLLLEEKLEIKREEYIDRHVVTKAVKLIADRLFATKSQYLWMDECQAMLDEAMPRHSYLLTDLLGSSLIAKEYNHKGKEYVRFTYQRMSDYFIANTLLNGCRNTEDLRERLHSNKATLAKTFVFGGVMEQLFIMIPERYDVEIWEVMDMRKVQNGVFLLRQSLCWRSAEHIHKKSILTFIEENGCLPEQWWNTILFLAPIPNHPFNGDYWSKIMKQASNMAERDAMLQNYILNTTQWRRYENSIYSLINWAWTKGISMEADDEVARLVAITLTWVLSSTMHQLRDQTTKALVNLLQHQPQTLLKVLQEFRDVDDMYIQERLLAIAYGCVLRCEQKDLVKPIGKWVYDNVFASGNPPRHLLIRDYACNIVDFAHRQCGLEDIDMRLALPPYGASMPQCPTRNQVEHYMVNNDTDKYASEQNAILFSLYKGIADFGHKRVEPDVQSFEPWNFRTEQKFQEYLKQTRGNKRKLLDAYILALRELHTEEQDRWGERKGVKKIRLLRSIVVSFEKQISTTWPDEKDILLKAYIPNHLSVNTSQYSNPRNAEPYQYWIVKRVFELGYDRRMHGWYDYNAQKIESYHLNDSYLNGRIERIGKKYEWIAYWELMGCFADNYYVEHPWEGAKKMLYDGAWLNYWRDCDPVCITKRNEDLRETIWQEYLLRGDWELPWEEWLVAQWEIEDVRQILWRKDQSGNTWFTLNDAATKHGPKELIGNRYRYERFYNYRVFAYFIHNKDKARLIKKAENMQISSHQLVHPIDSHTYYFVREKYWSRACKMEGKETKRIWDNFYPDCKIKVMMPYVAMSGDPEDDKSGTRALYYMPIQKVYEGMHLEYADRDGDLHQNGEVCATSNPNRSVHFLMKRDALMRYLDDNDLDIVWVITCERVRSVDDMSFQGAKMYYHSGLFYLDEDGDLKGKFNVWQRS